MRARLRVGLPNDINERESDRFSQDGRRPTDPGLRRPRSSGGECARSRNEGREHVGPVPDGNGRDLAEEALATERIEEVNGQVEFGIRKVAGGMPMQKSARAIFEPRFGRDFSHVRLHTNPAAISLARALRAAAFTCGSDIFFNAGGVRSPNSVAGRGLLAHELAHTIQQATGDVRVQRAIIPYRPITWADFLAAPPAGQNTAEGAGTLSRFDLIPSYTPVITAKPTKKPCRAGRIRAEEVEAIAAPDPADFNKPEAVMDQDQSWALPRYTGNGNDFCASEVTRCENQFDSVRASVRTNCERSAAECEQAFDRGEKAFGIALGRDSVRVTRKADCRTTFLTRCQEITSKAATVSIGSTIVRTKEDCQRTYFRQCLTSEVDERARLLRHEQGHFDITNVMARNARESVKLKAAGLSVKETGCGEDAARDAARGTYDSTVKSVLRQLSNDWLAAKDRAQQDYDGQTTHSSNAAKQRAWETDIAAGLKAYVPANAPVPAAAPAPPPGSPPAAPAPANPPAAPTAAPKRPGE